MGRGDESSRAAPLDKFGAALVAEFRCIRRVNPRPNVRSICHTREMARRRRIGTIRIKQTRKVTVTRRVTRQVVARPQARASISTRQTAPKAISRRTAGLTYSQPERDLLNHVREVVDEDIERDRDVFLCHAWADRGGPANELFEALSSLRVDAWFSERDVVLGKSLARQLDGGLRVSRVGIVLVTPDLLLALQSGGFADQELGALLATDRVIPVSHNVTYDELRAESPLLAARAGLSTADTSFADVAAKIAESVLDIDLD